MRTDAIRALSGKLTVLIYFAVVLLPVALFGYDGPWVGGGSISIRGKAPFPSKLTPGTFRDFDEWFADRVGLRYPLIYAGTELHIGVLHRPLDRHIFFGRDDWMFWTDDRETVPATMADSRGKLRFTPPEITRIDAQLRASRDQFAACGIPGVIVIAPNKQSLYGEFLVNADAGSPPTRLDALMNALSGPAKAMIVDPRATMRAAKLSHAPLHLYNKTESHWNALGAFYGYVAIISSLTRMIPIARLELTSLDHYRVYARRYPGGDMAVRVLFSPWRFADDDVLVEPKQPIPGLEVIQVAHEHTLYRNPQGKGRLVLFGDSFAHAVMPFLAQHFNEVHRFTGEVFDGSTIAAYRPTAVVLLMVERYANRLLRPPSKLAQMCESAAQ